MINLNDYTQEEKEMKIFNNGVPGKVKNVAVKIVKKTPEDHERAPDFKVNYIDSEGSILNDAIYYPKDSDTDSQKQINMSRLVSLLHAINPASKDKMLPEFNDYVTAVDFLVKQIIASSKDGRVNVFVAYGTKNNPQQYLRVRKFNFVEPASTEDSKSRLRVKISSNPETSQWDDMMERITPTEFKEEDTDTESGTTENDLDW